ncbi:MAG TPA: hypothetical protein VMM35_11050 [Longimicrobiales bacterium]|nr:hypothetical protein [Longimicrobiales bacterium]
MGAPALVGALALAVSACQQSDQELPFELDGGAELTIGVSGGLVSVPPSFSMQFPAGSLPATTQITAATRTAAFPSSAGVVIPGSAHDVGPAGVLLAAPARVQIAVPPALLDAGAELRLAVALLRTDGSIVTSVTSYDLSNGILTAFVDEVGPVAAVVSADVIPVLDVLDIPALAGGSVAPPSPASLPAGPVGPAQAPGDPEFTAVCSDEARSCLTSGIVQVWVDDVVRDRVGGEMVLANTTVTGSLEFLDFDSSGLPTRLLGSVEIEGELRARINSIVATRRVGDELVIHTGTAGLPPAPTAVTFAGNVMTLAETSEGANETIVYGVTGIGTGEQVTLRLEGEIEFSNPTEYGQIVTHVRLRR